MTGEGIPLGIEWHTDELVRIGQLTVRIVSDNEEFAALSYFSRRARKRVTPPGAELPHRVDAEIWCVSRGDPPANGLPAGGADTARFRGFRAGYYVTDHFGEPVHAIAWGHNRVLLYGPRLERLIWPYFVKYLLLRSTVAREELFLKAGAVAVGGNGTLLIGRGGAGKTVMLTALCQRGARYVTNSHAVVARGELRGVASSMRMRPGPWLDRLGARTSAAIDPAEVVVDPLDAFPVWADEPVRLRNIWVVDFRGPGRHEVREMSADEMLPVIDQFGLGLNVYRLEEDLLDDLGGDYRAFARACAGMRERLRDLVSSCRSYHVVSDVQDGAKQDRLLELLSGNNA